MKKALILLICALILTGCSGEKENDDFKETESVEITEEPVEETEEPEEDEWTEIYEKEYGTDSSGEKIAMSLSVNEDKKHRVNIHCIIDEEWKAAYAFTLYSAYFKAVVQSEEIYTNVMCKCGDVTMTNLGISFKSEDGNTSFIDADEWCEENSSKMPSEEAGREFITNLNNYYNNFVSGNDILKDFAIGDSGGSNSTEDTVVYQDENVIIHYTGMSEDGDDYDVNFTIENLSSKTLTIQVRETSINNFMVDPMCSIEIAPGKKAKDSMEIYGNDAKEYPMSSVESIETKFHIYNSENWSDYYDSESIKIK